MSQMEKAIAIVGIIYSYQVFYVLSLKKNSANIVYNSYSIEHFNTKIHKTVSFLYLSRIIYIFKTNQSSIKN